MKVIGIDPAPSKASHVVDSGSHPPEEMASEKLVEFLGDQREQNESLLVCWDAPLTGPAFPDDEDHSRHWVGDHTKRPIEKFFSQKKGLKTPKGISVQMYAGCSHWAFSQRVVGLPRTGPFMTHWSDLPFALVTEDEPPRSPGHYIVEVHPAVAIWMWVRHDQPDRPPDAWEYKKNDTVRQDIWDVLARRFEEVGVLDAQHDYEPGDDDDLDAFVAWALGKLWVRGSDEVTMLGNRRTGSMLIPNPVELDVHNQFSAFLSKIKLAELEA